MDKINIYDKIISPIVTEKSTNLSSQNKIVFTESSVKELEKRYSQWLKFIYMTK